MHTTLTTATLSLLSLLPLTLATNIPITVGANDKLAFNPPIVSAAPGDTLTFSYFPKNHSVVQSSFTDPCHPLAGGFFSGFQPLTAGPGSTEFVVTVKDTKPIWIYCAQTKGSHCQMGMAMVVNQPAPPSPNTLDAYKLAAAKTNVSTAPPTIQGGTFISTNGGTGGTSATSNMTSSTNSTGATGSSGSNGNSGTGSSGTGSSGSGSSGSGKSSSSGSSSSGTSTVSSNGGSTSILPFTGAGSKLAFVQSGVLAVACTVVFAML